MKVLLFFFTFFIAFGLKAAETNNQTVVLVADQWCPYNCLPESERPGYLVEIAKVVLSSHGYHVIYKTMEWNQAITLVRTGRANGLIGAFPSDAEDLIFPDTALGYADNSVIVRAQDSTQFKGIETLQELRLGVIEGYSYGAEIDKFLAERLALSTGVDVTSGDDPLERNLQMVLSNRLDGFIEDESVLKHHLRYHPDKDKFKLLARVSHDPVYIGFAPKHPESAKLAALLSDGIERLRKTGQLKVILQRYGLQDWY
ncbi:transporter substrate-binding domain-containing protein [Catenovulum sp. SM1970]|uniref:substrate-binding periplasmic protein n=1 Tax=Marinifaba aquimaris TaxID=2741323 RepID=UPI001571740C|nr:transporter substrate-binding domain-containing protein [Marinifaba aquimaris]NTS75541.1 transporter substrate-binding domain-containing protein [Marinifaba aquimaris]